MAYVRFNLVAFISNNLFNILSMNKRTIIVWVLLLFLTVTVGIISSLPFTYAAIIILVVSVIKFIGVSFYFMELKKAHIFWKVSIVIYVLLFSTIILISV